MSISLLALQWSYFSVGALIVVVLMALVLVPYLIKENRDGKRELGPMTRMQRGGSIVSGAESPAGAGDNKPGTVGDPAPGQPDAQADPYGSRAQRHAPPVKS